MSHLKEFFGTPEGQAMQWKAPDPDPTIPYKNAAIQERANFFLEFLRDGHHEATPPRSWEQLKAVDDKIAERAAAAKAVADEAKAAAQEQAAGRAKLKALEDQLEVAEAAARVRRVDEFMRSKNWDPRGPKRATAVSQLQKRGLL